MSNYYDITAVISTYNRSELLKTALESVLMQSCEGISFEVIVVDNNSTDFTREVVESYIRKGHTNLRYLFEPKQGSSYARNAGIAAARSKIIAFVDDDVRVAQDWIAKIKRGFDENPNVDCIGGKVLPLFASAPPAWLGRDHWMPLALQDYGDRPLSIGRKNPLCLVSANLAFRRSAIVDAGLFSPDLQRVKDSIGSMEDAELLERYWRSGRECMYLPQLVVKTAVPTERLTTAYHLRWHRGHGYFYAIRRCEEIDSAFRRLFDVPAHLYKQAIIDAACWLGLRIGNRKRAFVYETRLNFFLGFFRKRRADYLATAYRGFIHELISFARSFAPKRVYDRSKAM